MPYESLVGWRFLHRGRLSTRVLAPLISSLAVTGIGAVLFAIHGPTPFGVALLCAGALASVAFGLLALFSVFSTVSVFGVVLGVAALVVVLGVTSGFQGAFKDRVLGVNAHVIIMKSTGFDDYREVEDLARQVPHVIAAEPFMFEEMLVTRGKGELSAIAIKGVDPDLVRTVLDLPKHMVEGSVDELRQRVPGGQPSIIIGRELARRLRARVGDVLTIVSPITGLDLKTWSPTGQPPKSRKFVVRGIFYSGFDEYDRHIAYVNLKEVQDFLGQGDFVRGVELRLDDVDQAQRVKFLIQQKLGDEPYVVIDWRELNANLFDALALQKIVLVVFLTLIIIVAAFNLVAALSMMVIDKQKEIAVLKTMGSTDLGIAGVFQVVGLAIGGVGTVLGLCLGLLFCAVISRYGYRLDARVYLIDRLPIRVEFLEVALVGIATMVISFLATLYPALKASSMRPVEGLRYE